MNRLLLTRPAAQSQRCADACRAQFGAEFEVIQSPLMEIRPRPGNVDLTGVDAVIVSSENAAQIAVGRIDSQVPAWCVGERAATVLRDAGWQVAGVGANSAALLDRIAAAGPVGRLVHLSGSHIAADLVAELNAKGGDSRRIVIYDQAALTLTPAARMALDSPDPLLLAVFSPRSARLLLPELRSANAPLLIAAMSHAVAEEFGVHCDANIEVAESPDSPAMMSALSRLRGG